MKTAYRTSPLHSAVEALEPQWTAIGNMRVPFRFSTTDEAFKEAVGLTDLSPLPRFGLKGPGAEAWLATQGVRAPAGINRWSELAGGGIIARLGGSEFFVEDWHGGTAAGLRTALGRGATGVAPVLRQDAAIALAGRRTRELLVQTCGVNFAEVGTQERAVVMTSMVGVGVLIVPSLKKGTPLYRIWCDGTFGPYLWNTLLEIARELGGGPVGLQAFAAVMGMESQPANQQP